MRVGSTTSGWEVANTEEAVERMWRDCRAFGEPVFAVDMTEGSVALALAVLADVLYRAAFIASMHDDRARAFYERKRAESNRHHQAIIALARRRTDVLYAMPIHGTLYVSESVAA